MAIAACAAIAVPAGHTAPKPKTLTSKTLKVKPSGKTVKISAIRTGTKVELVLYVRRDGRFRQLDRATARKRFPEGAKIRPLTADQDYAGAPPDGGQGLLSWTGPRAGTADDYSNYFGFEIRKRSIELYR